jgi:predicted RNase H-like HicB family nuclease
MATHTVTYERDEAGWWVAEILDVQGCHTQGRTITQARERIREALAAFLGEKEAASAKLVDDVRLPAAVRKSIARAAAARQKASETQDAATTETTKAAQALTRDFGLSVRDAGELLGLSYQRVHQLVQVGGK